MTEPLETEFLYFLENRQDLNEMYKDKVIGIIGNCVVGVFDNEIEALKEMGKKYKRGTFLLQKLKPIDLQ